MKLSKLLKIIDPDSTITVINTKTRIAIYEGEARDFSDDREWKVKKIDNSYVCNFEIFVKEVKVEDAPL
jgi:hypothetical protein